MNPLVNLLANADIEAGTHSNGMSTLPSTSPVGRSQNRLPADLFPLEMTAFERLMFADDHADYPRTFTVVIEFEGRLHQPAFETAMQEVIRRHPLLSAVVRKRFSKLYWVIVPFPQGQIGWREELLETADSQLNLWKSPGFRVFGRTNGTTSEVRMVFHHAVTDGQGARRVILDWVTLYAKIMTPEAKSPLVRPLNYERLRSRDEFARNQPSSDASSVPASSTFMQRCRSIYEFFSQRPTPLRPAVSGLHHERHGDTQPLVHRFNRDEVNQFRDQLRGTRITLNDVAIALLLNSIARWNRGHGESGRDWLYRILVPVDLRETGDELMPAANRLSFVFITRPTSLCLDLPQLLPTIRAEMDYISRHGSKYNLLNALPIVQSIPGIVGLGVRAPVCLSTAILTNLGDVVGGDRFRFPEEAGRPLFGNLRFIRAGGAPPMRPKTRLGIGLSLSVGELTIYGQLDSRVFAPAHGEEFIRLFAESWRNWVSLTPGSI